MNVEAMTWPVGCRECFGYGEGALAANPFNSNPPSCAPYDGLLGLFFLRPVRCKFCWRRYYWISLRGAE